jgi:hypothetical protein
MYKWRWIVVEEPTHCSGVCAKTGAVRDISMRAAEQARGRPSSRAGKGVADHHTYPTHGV